MLWDFKFPRPTDPPYTCKLRKTSYFYNIPNTAFSKNNGCVCIYIYILSTQKPSSQMSCRMPDKGHLLIATNPSGTQARTMASCSGGFESPEFLLLLWRWSSLFIEEIDQRIPLWNVTGVGAMFWALFTPNKWMKYTTPNLTAGANPLVHQFLGGKGLGIQQGTSVWVGSSKSKLTHAWENPLVEHSVLTTSYIRIYNKRWIWSSAREVFGHSRSRS